MDVGGLQSGSRELNKAVSPIPHQFSFSIIVTSSYTTLGVGYTLLSQLWSFYDFGTCMEIA
jgi:hypothetical protein